ncbi:helix-turn-helix transcriptional regulator [Vibrio harveyi]|uniref:helix-turn-helix transcriptional regulator n=1 Tax=Vibrio harveyi TaxID=669 RepID=UPI0033942B4B
MNDEVIDDITDELMSFDSEYDVVVEQYRNALSASFIVDKNELYNSCIKKIKLVESLQCYNLEVISIDSPSYVNLSESATAAGLTKSAISNFYQGIRGDGNFPSPSMKISNKNPLWFWSDISKWLVENGKMTKADLDTARIIHSLNLALQIRRTSSLSEVQDAFTCIMKDA